MKSCINDVFHSSFFGGVRLDRKRRTATSIPQPLNLNAKQKTAAPIYQINQTHEVPKTSTSPIYFLLKTFPCLKKISALAAANQAKILTQDTHKKSAPKKSTDITQDPYLIQHYDFGGTIGTEGQFNIITEKCDENRLAADGHQPRKFIAINSYRDLLNISDEDQKQILKFARQTSDKDGVFAFVFSNAGFQEFKDWQKYARKNNISRAFILLARKIKKTYLSESQKAELKKTHPRTSRAILKEKLPDFHPSRPEDVNKIQQDPKTIEYRKEKKQNLGVLHADTNLLAMLAIFKGRQTLYLPPQSSYLDPNKINFAKFDTGAYAHRNFTYGNEKAQEKFENLSPDDQKAFRATPKQSLTYVSAWVIHQTPNHQKRDSKRRLFAFGNNVRTDSTPFSKTDETARHELIQQKYKIPDEIFQRGQNALLRIIRP